MFRLTLGSNFRVSFVYNNKLVHLPIEFVYLSKSLWNVHFKDSPKGFFQNL